METAGDWAEVERYDYLRRRNAALDSVLFHIEWCAASVPGEPDRDMWIAINKKDDESWWFDASLLGRCRLDGGRQRVDDFAQWLLAPVPEGAYETEFVLIDNERQTVDHAVAVLREGQYLNIEILLGRGESGGPEYLTVVPTGDTGSPSYRPFLLFSGLEYEPVDRDYLERAAAELLEAL